MCFNYRHYTLIQRLREMLTGGQYGEMHFVHGSYVQDWLLYETDWNWRLDPADNGVSRAVADIGSHWIDLVQYVTGQRIAEVFADLGMHHPVRQRPQEESATFGNRRGRERGAGNRAHRGLRRGDPPLRLRRAGHFRGVAGEPGAQDRLTFQVDTADAAISWDQEHRTHTTVFPLGQANEALSRLRNGSLVGAAVLRP